MHHLTKHEPLEPDSSDDTASDSDDDVNLFTQKFMSQVKHARNANKSAHSDSNASDTSESDSNMSYIDDEMHQSHPSHVQYEHFTNDIDKSSSSRQVHSQTKGHIVAKGGIKNRDSIDSSDDNSEAERDEGSTEDSSDEVDSEGAIEENNEDVGQDDDGESDSSDEDGHNSSGDIDSESADDTRDTVCHGSALEDVSEEDETETTKQDVECGFEQLRKELADLPFSELQQLKEKIGIKTYNEAMFGYHDKSSRKKVFKRENKNRPMEMSSRRPVKFRTVPLMKKKVNRDPRFDDLSGQYDEKLFKHSYSFLDDIKIREKQKLIKRFSIEKDVEKKSQIEQLIKRLNQEERSEREKAIKQYKETERKKKEKNLVKQGKRPYFLKKADEKKLELADKFRDLKKSGKVENYLAKKRKKMTAKDRRQLPNKHLVFT